jgi:hypothetical protein
MKLEPMTHIRHEEKYTTNEECFDLNSLFLNEPSSDDVVDAPRVLILYSELPVEEWIHIHGIHANIPAIVICNINPIEGSVKRS